MINVIIYYLLTFVVDKKNICHDTQAVNILYIIYKLPSTRFSTILSEYATSFDYFSE